MDKEKHKPLRREVSTGILPASAGLSDRLGLINQENDSETERVWKG